jgi:hypothetical protein
LSLIGLLTIVYFEKLHLSLLGWNEEWLLTVADESAGKKIEAQLVLSLLTNYPALTVAVV